MQELIATLLPPPAEIFTDDFFQSPLFPVASLYDVASLYGCATDHTEIGLDIELSHEDANNRSVISLLWLVNTLICDSVTAKEVLDKYKISKKRLRLTVFKMKP